MSYQGAGIKIELIVHDEDYKVLDTFKFKKEQAPAIANILQRKYGIIFVEGLKKEIDRDLDWLKDF